MGRRANVVLVAGLVLLGVAGCASPNIAAPSPAPNGASDPTEQQAWPTVGQWRVTRMLPRTGSVFCAATAIGLERTGFAVLLTRASKAEALVFAEGNAVPSAAVTTLSVVVDGHATFDWPVRPEGKAMFAALGDAARAQAMTGAMRHGSEMRITAGAWTHTASLLGFASTLDNLDACTRTLPLEDAPSFL